jgi:hypothetical protein
MGRLDTRDADVDELSSGRWFDGWAEPVQRARQPSAVEPPRTWLARTGWRREGLISLSEVTGTARERAASAG